MNDLSTSYNASAGDHRLAVSPVDAARLAGVGRTTLYQALSSGELRSLKIGSRRLITVQALKDWLEAAERASTSERDHAG